MRGSWGSATRKVVCRWTIFPAATVRGPVSSTFAMRGPLEEVADVVADQGLFFDFFLGPSYGRERSINRARLCAGQRHRPQRGAVIGQQQLRACADPSAHAWHGYQRHKGRGITIAQPLKRGDWIEITRQRGFRHTRDNHFVESAVRDEFDRLAHQVAVFGLRAAVAGGSAGGGVPGRSSALFIHQEGLIGRRKSFEPAALAVPEVTQRVQPIGGQVQIGPDVQCRAVIFVDKGRKDEAWLAGAEVDRRRLRRAREVNNAVAPVRGRKSPQCDRQVAGNGSLEEGASRSSTDEGSARSNSVGIRSADAWVTGNSVWNSSR